MAGCFGNSREDRSRERELFRYLDSLAYDEMTEEEREALEDERDREQEARSVAWENKWRGER